MWTAQNLRWPRPLSPHEPEPVAPWPSPEDSHVSFLGAWREELLTLTWKALADANPTYYAVLLQRVNNPEASSAELAEQFSAQSAESVSAAWVRKTLQRAHQKCARLLIDQVASSLPDPNPKSLQRELLELDLLKYCRSLLK
jgi:hypothetical protein